jgi:hypothetical protein
MDYKRIHDKIIERAKTRILIGYAENHHIIPKCLGGDNKKSNLIKLTAREHFLVHKLLCEIYPDNTSLLRAYWLMSNKLESSVQNRRYKVGNREYERLRIEFGETQSKEYDGKFDGKNNPFYGKTHSDETIQKLRDKLVSEETRKKMSISAKKRGSNNKGHVKTKETIRKLRENSPNSKQILHLESGIVYCSMKEASRQCGIASRNIFNHCNNLVKNSKFKYVDKK